MTEEQKNELKKIIQRKLNMYSNEKQTRELAYATRLDYYSGNIGPEVGDGHEKITTALCSSIADKMAAYIGTNCFDLNISAKDISNDAENNDAQFTENIVKDIFEGSDKKSLFLEANEVASRMGDGIIITEVVAGMPYHSVIHRPENVYFLWRTDNFKELVGWAYEWGMTEEEAYDRFGEKLPTSFSSGETASQGGISRNTRDVYGLGITQTAQPAVSRFVKITDFHYFYDIRDDNGKVLVKANTNVVLANDEIKEVNEGMATKIYLFLANTYPRMATGICDFEFSADMVTAFDKKLSEEADAISQSVYHKFVTNSNTPKQVTQALMPNKSQLVKLQDDEKLEVLKLNSNSYESEPLIKNLLNIIRTLSGLQELGQDQISPNVSGRALVMIFQGVIQQATKKRIRWERIIKDMIVDDLDIVSKENPKMKKIFFDSDGVFRFNIEILWADVLESDKASKIANIVNLRSGTEPIVSAMTARTMAEIPNPQMEEKRINLEMEKNIERQQALSGSLAEPTESTPVLTEDQNQEEGIPSSQGQAGTAQTAGMSVASANKMNQNRGV